MFQNFLNDIWYDVLILYSRNKILQQSDGLHDMGVVNWQLLLCFIAAWIIIYLCVIKGVKSSGKVGQNVFYLSPFPFHII